MPARAQRCAFGAHAGGPALPGYSAIDIYVGNELAATVDNDSGDGWWTARNVVRLLWGKHRDDVCLGLQWPRTWIRFGDSIEYRIGHVRAVQRVHDAIRKPSRSILGGQPPDIFREVTHAA